MSGIDIHQQLQYQQDLPEYFGIVHSVMNKTVETKAFRIIPDCFQQIKDCNKVGLHKDHEDSY